MPGDLAKAVGVSPWMVRQWEQGKSAPRSSRLRAVAEALGVAFDWLAHDVGPMETASNIVALRRAEPPTIEATKGVDWTGPGGQPMRNLTTIKRVPIHAAKEEENREMSVAALALREDPRPDDLTDEAYGIVVPVRGLHRLPQGSTAYVNPLLPAVEGEFVLLRTGKESDARGLLGRLIDYNEREWTIKAQDDQDPVRVSRAIWKECHMIVSVTTRLLRL